MIDVLFCDTPIPVLVGPLPVAAQSSAGGPKTAGYDLKMAKKV